MFPTLCAGLETAYLEQNRWEFELTKHISVTLPDPLKVHKIWLFARCTIPDEPVAVYAGLEKSGLFCGGDFAAVERDGLSGRVLVRLTTCPVLSSLQDVNNGRFRGEINLPRVASR